MVLSVRETRCEGGEWRGRAGAGGARRDEAGESEGGISTERLSNISGLTHGASWAH